MSILRDFHFLFSEISCYILKVYSVFCPIMSKTQFDFYIFLCFLFNIYTLLTLNVGTVGVEHVDSESRVSPGSPALKAKLMSIFCRSIAAANNFPSTLQCIFGCIYGSIIFFYLMILSLYFLIFFHPLQKSKLVGHFVA